MPELRYDGGLTPAFFLMTSTPMTTTQRIKHAHVEHIILENCNSLSKISKTRATIEGISDDFEHKDTKIIVESKRAQTTVNQVHPVKADVVIISKSNDEHIVVTMGELFPILGRQHAVHRWECASTKSKTVFDRFGPWVSNEFLEMVVEDAVGRAIKDVDFKQRQIKARQLMQQLNEQFESI